LPCGFPDFADQPETLLFYGAFFPQFIAPDRAIGPQLGLLCGSFLLVAVTLDSGWALAAGRARRVLAVRGKLRNRLSGGLLIAPDWAWHWRIDGHSGQLAALHGTPPAALLRQPSATPACGPAQCPPD